jgi:hypothetical protein
MIVLGSARTLSGTIVTVVTAAENSGMPGETHQVDYDGDTAVHRSRAARGEFGDRAPWSEIDPRLTDLVTPAAMSIAANFDAGGLGGL